MHLLIGKLGTYDILNILGETLHMVRSAELMPELRNGLDFELETISILLKENKIDKIKFKDSTGQVPENVFELLMKEKEEHHSDVLTHGDYCIPNLLIKDGKLSGIIDWGKSGKGDLYRDLSSVEGSLMRNIGISGMRDLFIILGLDYEKFSRKKIEFYKKIDQFWYNYVETL
jgi:aminoglycoside phosphotransferase